MRGSPFPSRFPVSIMASSLAPVSARLGATASSFEGSRLRPAVGLALAPGRLARVGPAAAPGTARQSRVAAPRASLAAQKAPAAVAKTGHLGFHTGQDG